MHKPHNDDTVTPCLHAGGWPTGTSKSPRRQPRSRPFAVIAVLQAEGANEVRLITSNGDDGLKTNIQQMQKYHGGRVRSRFVLYVRDKGTADVLKDNAHAELASAGLHRRGQIFDPKIQTIDTVLRRVASSLGIPVFDVFEREAESQRQLKRQMDMAVLR